MVDEDFSRLVRAAKEVFRPMGGRVNLEDPGEARGYRLRLYREQAIGAMVFGGPAMYWGQKLWGLWGALGGLLVACVLLWHNLGRVEERVEKQMETQQFLNALNRAVVEKEAAP